METTNPVIMQALSVSGAIIVAKSLFALAKASGWINVENPDVEVAWLGFIENALPIVIIWLGAFWASRRTADLKNPKDIDGAPLSRADNTPTIPQMANMQEEAAKLDKQIDDRRLVRK